MATVEETIYLGRDNPIVRELLQDGVAPVGLTRVIARIESICLDSSVDTTKITLTGGNIVTMYFGDEALTPELHTNILITAFDASTVDGIAWGIVPVYVRNWPVCV